MVLSGPTRGAGEGPTLFEVPVVLHFEIGSRTDAVQEAREIAAVLEERSALTERVDPVATENHPMLRQLGIEKESAKVPLIMEVEGINRTEAIRRATEIVPLRIPKELRRRIVGVEIVESQDPAHLEAMGVAALGRPRPRRRR